MYSREPAQTPLKQQDFLIATQIVPLVGRLRNLVVNQWTVPRMVCEEVKNILNLLVWTHEFIIVHICLLFLKTLEIHEFRFNQLVSASRPRS